MGVMDIVHGVLDVAGFIPVIGAAADVANAAIYAVEGDWGNAALSMVAAAPGIGDAAAVGGMALKVGIKATKAGKTAKVAKTSGALSKAKKMKLLTKKTAGKAKTGAKKSKIRNKKASKYKKQKHVNKEKCKKAGSCFTGDMLVYTPNGFCQIQKIQDGDDIYSRNAQTGENGFRKVHHAVQSEAHTIYHIWLDATEEIKTTAYHRLYTKEKGWVYAINLREGVLLETSTGEAKVTKIFKIRHEEPVDVYNFEVEEWESYFVSGMQVYVHNGRCKDKREKLSNVSGKEGAKNIPSWVKEFPNKGENGKTFAKRVCDAKYGEGNYVIGPRSEYNKIKKWVDRSFKK